MRRKKNLPYLDGRKAKSEFEVKIYEQAKCFDDDALYEAYQFSYVTKHVYTPDVAITTKFGKMIHIEAKGNGRSFDSTTRAKMVAVKKQYPLLDIRFVFYRDGKVGNKKKDGTCTTQSQWAAKNGFKWAIGSIPEEWFNE